LQGGDHLVDFWNRRNATIWNDRLTQDWTGYEMPLHYHFHATIKQQTGARIYVKTMCASHEKP
jgi:hypothetical protein